MATLQKTFKYEGNASVVPFNTVNLNFEVPSFEFVSTFINNKPLIERSVLGDQTVTSNKKLSESSYRINFPNEYLIGST